MAEEFDQGTIIPLRYAERNVQGIVIDPHALGHFKPSIGIGLQGVSRLMGIDASTLSRRVLQIDNEKGLKLPSGNVYRVLQILADDGNDYLTIEFSDWSRIAGDWLKKPGKLRQSTKDSLIDFLSWYTAQGLYASAYTLINRVFTRKDSEAVRSWLMARETGKPYRAEWSAEVNAKDRRKRFAILTNRIYLELFGMNATEMKEYWQAPVTGSSKIARNYVPQERGLEAIAYCEEMVANLDFDDIDQAHTFAIAATHIKFPDLAQFKTSIKS